MAASSRWCGCLVILCMAGIAAAAEEDYAARFLKAYPKVEQPPALADYATADRFDREFLGSNIDANVADAVKSANDKAGFAWWLSYYMRALNLMHRATGDVKYLEVNRRFVEAVVNGTDDKRGKQLYTGRVAAGWGCDIYNDRGRSVFSVHTGIIAAQVFEFLLLAKEQPAFSKAMGATWEAWFKAAEAALAVHDREWRDGPEEGAGHYIGIEQVPAWDNKPMPGNWQSAMGWAHWMALKAGGGEMHRDRALALGQYLRHRLNASPDGAYYWPYQLPDAPVTGEAERTAVNGEDTSHASLTLALPMALAADGQVFNGDDLKRFAKTVIHGFARQGDGMLYAEITGAGVLGPDYIGHAANWLPLGRTEPEAAARIVAYYLGFRPKVQPLDLAQLVLWVKKG